MNTNVPTTCEECGGRLECLEGEAYCPDCTRYDLDAEAADLDAEAHKLRLWEAQQAAEVLPLWPEGETAA